MDYGQYNATVCMSPSFARLVAISSWHPPPLPFGKVIVDAHGNGVTLGWLFVTSWGALKLLEFNDWRLT